LVNRKCFLTGALLLSVGLVGCNTPQVGAGSSQVEVEASFRERLALAPGVRLEASLLDISRADATAAIVGKTVLEDVGLPPYRFTIAYDPAAIVTSHRYAVRVVLMKDARLIFTTDQVYPVLTGGNPASVQVLLKRVGGGQ
jgi:putative lipoprotein